MITLTADKLKVNGPQLDGGYAVTFYVGGYQAKDVGLLFAIPQLTSIILEIKPKESHEENEQG